MVKFIDDEAIEETEPIIKIKIKDKWLDLVEEEAAIVAAVLADLAEALDQALSDVPEEI